MFQPTLYSGKPEEDYPLLCTQFAHLIEDEPNRIANMANAAALLWHGLQYINWAGFYLYEPESNQLVLGPFQGLPACVRIPMGRGVCGTAASEQQTQLVPDVHAFPGHIACDAQTRSEIVIPLIQNGALIGVLDIDSPVLARFSEVDRVWLEKFAALLV